MTNFSLPGPPKLGKPGQPDHEVIVQSARAPPSVEQQLFEARRELSLIQSKLTRLVEACRGVDKPISMQDVRLCAGGGNLSAYSTLQAVNAILERRFRTLSEALEGGDEMASVASRADAPRFAAAEEIHSHSEGDDR